MNKWESFEPSSDLIFTFRIETCYCRAECCIQSKTVTIQTLSKTKQQKSSIHYLLKPLLFAPASHVMINIYPLSYQLRKYWGNHCTATWRQSYRRRISTVRASVPVSDTFPLCMHWGENSFNNNNNKKTPIFLQQPGQQRSGNIWAQLEPNNPATAA